MGGVLPRLQGMLSSLGCHRVLRVSAWPQAVPARTHSHTSHPPATLSKGLKKLIKRIEKQEAAEQEAERRSTEAAEP